MTYIKKLVVKGFKSFVRETNLPFTEGINVILGPNGSGKSNVSDALCFVLGRLSSKSMRASKTQNLIFLGTKDIAPAKEASVEIVFDNSDKTFSLEKTEISIRRIVRKNGQSIYKINEETKTRQEVLTLLAQGGIDPNGFNIILQGEIQNFVRMHTEERRKIIEEVSGISIYESRKEKSLKELDKTEEKLKEVLAILRERTAYLNNLEKERQQALKYKKLEEDLKKFKASILFCDLSKKKKEVEAVMEEIEKKNKEIDKIKRIILEEEQKLVNFQQKISSINSTIQQATGFEQEQLNREIANLRADLAGILVKIENHESKISHLSKQKIEYEQKLREVEVLVRDLQKESPTIAKKQKEIDQKKKELEELEKERKKFYMTRSELKSVRDRLQDKISILRSYETESNYIIKEMETITLELFDRKNTPEKISQIRLQIAQKTEQLESLNRREMDLEKVSHTNEYEITKQKAILDKIASMDICPLCKSRITPEHIQGIGKEVHPKIDSLRKEIDSADKELSQIYETREILKKDLDQLKQELSKREADIIKFTHIESKQRNIKNLQEKIDEVKKEISEIEKRKKTLETGFDENSNIEEKYDTVSIELREIGMRTEENVNSEISFKQRELDRIKIAINQSIREEEDLREELVSLKTSKVQKESQLEEKRRKEEELAKKFQKLIAERDFNQAKVRETELDISSKKSSIQLVDNSINNFKIEKAKFDAEIENLEIEILEFPNIEIVKASKDSLTSSLARTQEILSQIGTVNLRSLEVYDEIKKEYDSVKEKSDVILNEKESIIRIIHEIDIKKKKTFMATFDQLNEIFSRNFAQISTKGQVSLELEDKKDPFVAGVSILVKTGHGKYFDVTSLSGGEQTMVALSLIFAIQELKPYCFYILDEIDAALDKRNSERLGSLLRRYMQKGQYIVITHNDEIINSATNLYGVSMHDGISKVISLKI